MVTRPNFTGVLAGWVFRHISSPSVLCSLLLGPLLASAGWFIFQIWGMVMEMLILGLFCDGLGPFSPSPTAWLCSAPVVGGGRLW